MKKTERITDEDAKNLLTKLIHLRSKYNKYRSKGNYRRYQEFKEYCCKKFDFLVLLNTYKYRNFSNYQDLQQDGRTGLLMALNSYLPNKGSFFYWANLYIKTKVSREANCHSTIKIPLAKTKEFTPFKETFLPTLIESSQDALKNFQDSEMISYLYDAIEELPDLQKKIIKMSGIKSYSVNEIADDLNISRPTCIKLLNEARATLKENLEHLHN